MVWIGACEHGRYLIASLSTNILDKNMLRQQLAVLSHRELLVPSAFPGTSKKYLDTTWYLCLLATLSAGKTGWFMVTAELLELRLVLSPEDVCVSKSRWALTLRHEKRLTSQAVSGVWRRVQEGGGYPTGKESWETGLSQKVLTEPLPSFTDFLPQQGSGHQGSPWELCKGSLADGGVLLAGREKTFLVSLTLADKITTVLTSCSCNKVLSSLRGGCKIWSLAGCFPSLDVLCVKSQKDFPWLFIEMLLVWLLHDTF